MSIDRCMHWVKVVAVGAYRGARGAISTEKWRTRYEKEKAERNAATDERLSVVDWSKVDEVSEKLEQIGCWKCRAEKFGKERQYDGSMVLCTDHLIQRVP